jgi:hypothetical protein
MSATYETARDKARAAREMVFAELEAAGLKPPKLEREGGCDHWYDEAQGHYLAAMKAFQAGDSDAALDEIDLGLACDTAGDGCVALKSTLP